LKLTRQNWRREKQHILAEHLYGTFKDGCFCVANVSEDVVYVPLLNGNDVYRIEMTIEEARILAGHLREIVCLD
jgi:hypothetical protein